MSESINCRLIDCDQKPNLNQNPISIVWHNLRYEVNNLTWRGSRKSTNILNRLNGHFEFGSLNGLLGPSGSGKSSLLNCLSGNVSSGLCRESRIHLTAPTDSPKMSTCFIEQDVQHCIATRLTVREIFRYAFKFKNRLSDHSEPFIDHHIDTVMQELMLSHKLTNQIYGCCSGGEQKRIAIGQELMTLQSASHWFVDEPTTGLDSLAALQMVKCLKELTLNHRITVIATIHQPSSEALSLFDKLYVLAKGGVCIYSGPPDSIETNLQLLNQNFSKQYRPIENLLKLACNGLNDQNVQKLAQTTLTREHDEILFKMSKPGAHHFHAPLKNYKSFSFSDLALHCQRLFRITFIANIRAFVFCVGLFVGNFALMCSIFTPSPLANCLPLDNSTINCREALEKENHNRENVFSIAYTLLYFGIIIAYLSTVIFSINVKIFRNEHQNGWYSLTVFYISSIIVNVVELAVYALIVSLLGYFLSIQQMTAESAQLLNWNRFGRYSFLIWVFAFYVQNFGQLFGLLFVDQPTLGLILSIVYYSFTSMANGLYVNLENSDNPVISYGTELVAMKFISKGIIYAVFGLEQCDMESEYSYILLFYNIHGDDLGHYLTWIVSNVVTFRLLTLVCLFVKFHNFHWPFVQYGEKPCDMSQQFEPIQLIDFEELQIDAQIEIYIQKENTFDDSSKDEQNLQREQFATFALNKIIIAWRNMSLYKSKPLFVQQKDGIESSAKMILNNLNGHFCFGTVNALMGPSGVGKTSLLRALSGQLTGRLSTPTRLYTSKYTQIECCFVNQDISEHLLTGLTVGQILLYASRLKNEQNGDRLRIDHTKIVFNLLAKLQLVDRINTKIEKCSGGERKRIALAQELTALQMPNLIFVDEPTSGLDSNSAEIVISCLRNLAQAHCLTIVISIHQPNTEMLLMFDQLYMLARGGVCIYSGPPTEIHHHNHDMKLAQSGAVRSLYDLVDKLLLYSCRDADRETSILQMIQTQIQNELTFDDRLESQTGQTDSIGSNSTGPRLTGRSVYHLVCRYVAYLAAHQWREYALFPFSYFFYGIMLKAFFDFKMVHISGCIELNKDFNNTCDLFENIENLIHLAEDSKYTFLFSIIYMLFVFMQTSLSFHNDFVYFKNEHRNGWYSSGAYYLTKSIMEIVFMIPINFAYVYITAHYYEAVVSGIYWKYVLVLSLSIVALQGMAHIFVLTTSSLYAQSFISITVFLFTILFANLYIPLRNLGPVYQFVANFAVVRFCFEALILLQYSFGRCGDKEIQATLYLMQIEEQHMAHCIGMLIFNLILYRLVALWLLLRKVDSRGNCNRRKNNNQTLNNTCVPAHSGAIISGLSSFHQFRIKSLN